MLFDEGRITSNINDIIKYVINKTKNRCLKIKRNVTNSKYYSRLMHM